MAGKQHLPYLPTRFGPKRNKVFAFCIDYLLPRAVSIALDFLCIHSDLKDVTLILLKSSVIVYNSEVVTLLVSDMKFPLSTEQGLNRMDARKFA